MIIYEISCKGGYKGKIETYLIKAENETAAENKFVSLFPKKKKYIFAIDEFIYKSWMKPLDQLEVFE
jgi:hypothetical protein